MLSICKSLIYLSIYNIIRSFARSDVKELVTKLYISHKYFFNCSIEEQLRLPIHIWDSLEFRIKEGVRKSDMQPILPVTYHIFVDYINLGTLKI